MSSESELESLTSSSRSSINNNGWKEKGGGKHSEERKSLLDRLSCTATDSVDVPPGKCENLPVPGIIDDTSPSGKCDMSPVSGIFDDTSPSRKCGMLPAPAGGYTRRVRTHWGIGIQPARVAWVLDGAVVGFVSRNAGVALIIRQKPDSLARLFVDRLRTLCSMLLC